MPFSSVQARKHLAYLFCAAGMGIDAVLGIIKIVMGWESSSISVMGDGFNNMTDVGSTFLLMLTFYYASKPSDREHPFGHGRLEYLNSTVMAAVVLYVGITLCVDSGKKIMNPEPVEFSPLLVAVLLIGILGKLALSYVYRQAEKKTGSAAFSAYGADSLSDVLSTAAVLVAVIAEKFTGFHIDGYMGVLVSLAIMYTGYEILKRALNAIIGAPPDAGLYHDIEQFILSARGIYGVHDLIIHDYGPENQFLSAHVEVDSRWSLVQSHELADQVMEAIKEKFHIQAVLHVDPKAVGNPREKQYMRDLESALYRTGLPLSYHDFFVEEKGEDVYITFELSFTGPCDKSDADIYQAISKEMTAVNPHYYIDLMVDRNFISGKRYGYMEKEEEKEKPAEKGREKQ